MKTKHSLIFIFLGLILASLMNCSSSRQFNLTPIKTFDPDNKDISPPEILEENQIWDLVDMTAIYQIGKPLDLNWTFHRVGEVLQVSGKRQADNVNALDEVPNSSWYTNRHFHHSMTIAELKQGPNVNSGPDQNSPLTIIRGKFEGGTPGFFIEDVHSNRYILKFDALKYPEMGSSAEVISTKILYACGYNVPQNTIEFIDPDNLKIKQGVKILDGGVKRQMNQDDLERMLKDIPRYKDGKIRVLASKFVNGKPVGIWEYRGMRNDDPNDLVAHQHRRELRGLRVISSWLNDADRRAANTLAVYTEKNGKKYIKHYLIDMGSTLGSNNKFPHAPKYGNEYLVDPRNIAKSMITLGLWEKPWETETGHINPRYPSVGYFVSDIFDPGSWVPTYPNPAFEKSTLRDAYWGAKRVMAFTDEEIRAIVETAQMSNTDASEYLIQTLIDRRDKVGRYWFSRMNPLDKFRIVRKTNENVLLKFNDLAVDGNLESPKKSAYLYALYHKDEQLRKQNAIQDPTISLSFLGKETLDSFLKNNKFKSEEDKIFKLKLTTKRGADISKAVGVHFYYPGKAEQSRIVGIVREE